MNAKKTQFMVYNQPTRVKIHTVDGSCLEEVRDIGVVGSEHWARHQCQKSYGLESM